MYRISLSFLIVVVFIMGVTSVGAEYSEPEGWLRGDMTVSEKAYYQYRISYVCSRWYETARTHRLNEPYDVYLVVDPDKPALWLEQDGQVLEPNYLALPRDIQWVLYHVDQETKRRFPRKTRLKLRIPYRRRQVLPEAVWFLARGKGGDFRSIYLTATSGCQIGYTNIPPEIKPLGAQSQDREFTESFVVSDGEYEQYRSSLDDETATAGESIKIMVSDPNVSEWLKVEKQIYWEIENQTAEQDYVLSHLRIMPYAERETARGEIRTRYRSGFTLPYQLRGRNMFPEPLIKIDHIGGGIWYVQGIEKTLKSWSKNLHLEFLVSARGLMGGRKYRKLLFEARRRHSAVRKPRKEWMVSLINGAVLELAGVCDYPSPGKKWWGPNGTSLDYEPIYYLPKHKNTWNDLPAGYYREGDLRMEVAFVINWPNGVVDNRMIEIPSGGWSRGGSLADEEVLVRPYSCERGRQSFDVTVRVSTDRVRFETVTFKNISLKRGANIGFVIEVEE